MNDLDLEKRQIKTLSEDKKKGVRGRTLSILFPWTSLFQLQTATLVMLGMIGFFGAIATSWFLGESTISTFFAQLHFWQENSPIWIRVSQVSHPYYLLVPTAVLFLLAQVIMKLSPQPQTWSRNAVALILLALTIRYLIWRSFSTLILDNPLDGIFSLGLLILEVFFIFTNSVQLFLMFFVKDRRQQSDRMAKAVIDGEYTPTVDILIPTYNEPDFILRRTIIGCQAIDYSPKKIYLLDDTRRLEIKQLAQQLGCEYITRPNNTYAKAGNLNHALAKTSGELVVVFDADFVPTSNFLTRTVGWFQDLTIGLVQTNQHFYNRDPVARNLGLEDVLTEEVEIFSSHYQLLRDGVETAVCYGSSFVVRRSYLREIGGFVTDSLSEDYFTGIRLNAKGYRLIYLDEKLSSGLAAENIAAHIFQRQRWARGTLQAFFIDSNPLTIPGLSLVQRIVHLEGILQWFHSIFRILFLFLPIIFTFFGLTPMRLPFNELLYFVLPYYLTTLATFSWLNKQSRSALLSDLYSLSQCFPLAITAIQVMLRPFSEGFKVTPKGLSQNSLSFNWTLAAPLILVFILNLISSSFSLLLFVPTDSGLIFSKHLTWVVSLYNLVMMSAALLIMVDAPKLDFYEWFPLRQQVQLTSAKDICEGITTKISEVGAEIELQQEIELSTDLRIEMLAEGLTLQGKITQTNYAGELPKIKVCFKQVSISQHRRLVEILFCRPNQWQSRQTPGELRSVWILLQLLFRPLQFLKIKAVFKSYGNSVTPVISLHKRVNNDCDKR